MMIRELCVALGTAERTLYLGFRECFGRSPLTYLKGLWLEAAHRDLRRSRAATTVTTTAAKWGFFQFGELPFQTLRSAMRTDRQTAGTGDIR
jgi:AraC family ethanolamine operon transcriptional activator